MIADLEALLAQWDSATGEGITVALLDTGVDPAHPQIRGAEVESVVPLLEDGRVVVEPVAGSDPAGHGTACAARILMMAPRAKILSCRVLSDSLASTSRLFIGTLDWLQERGGVQVINLSLGTPNRDFGLEIAHAVDRFQARGVPVVASAGPASRPDYPAVFTAPISVTEGPEGCTEWDLFFRPDDVVEFATCGRYTGVGGSGVSISMSGSSFAAPLVSGRLARFLELSPGLRVWELKTLLHHQALRQAALCRK